MSARDGDALRARIRAQLTGPGGPFEVVEAEVRGERLGVLKNRPPSLRHFVAAAAAQGDKEHFVQGDWRITFRDFVGHVGSVARALEERHGVRKGDRVAILAANCAEWAITHWAAVSLGAITASMNGLWTADEIQYGVADSEPRLLVGDRKRLERVKGVDLGVPVLEIEAGFRSLLAHAPGAPLPETPIAEDDPAVILYTSGTTGRPKGAINSHRGIVGFIQCNMLAGYESLLYDAEVYGKARPTGPGPQQTTLATSPFFHLSGLYGTIVMGLVGGTKILIRQGRFDPAEVLALIEKERVTTWTPLGSMGPRVIAEGLRRSYDLGCVTNTGFGGAPVSPAVQEGIRKLFPKAASNTGIGYGSSESITVPVGIRGEEYKLFPESTGRPAAMHQVEIRDESGKPVPDGVDGQIWVRSPYVMLGYWRKPEATAQVLKPGLWLSMGDIGHFKDGLLYVNSRARDMILVNAENVYPVEIEYRLEAHPGVREAAVIGVDDELTGMAVKAVVVCEPGARPGERELASWVGETLAAYKVPTRWEIRSEPLPRNPSGKILKNVLRGEVESAFVEE
jgi:acyl-CoA synthetase (AMP-forming)/AMP-acid ligase II